MTRAPKTPTARQAVLPPKPLTFFGALAQVLVAKAVIESCAPSQRKSEVEGVAAPTGVRVFFIV